MTDEPALVRSLPMGLAAVVLIAASGFLGGCQRPPAAEEVRQVSAGELKEWMLSGRQLTLIDVREDDEWRAGHAAAAVHLPRWRVSGAIGSVVPDKTSRIVLYCKAGTRSAISALVLQHLGYQDVFSLKGGFKTYEAAGLPVKEER